MRIIFTGFRSVFFLFICRLDPRATTEEVPYTPLELAAINENTEVFDLLALHYEDNANKKIAQLMIWGLTDSAPDEEFKLLFESVSLDEVELKYFYQIVGKPSQCSHR